MSSQDQDHTMSTAPSAQDQVAALSLQLQQQQEFFQRQLQELKSSMSQPAASPIVQSSKEPKLPTPEKFNGNQRDLKNFIASVNNVISVWNEFIKPSLNCSVV